MNRTQSCVEMMYIHFDIASVWDYCFVSSKVYTYIKIVLEQMGQIQGLSSLAVFFHFAIRALK